MKKKLTLVSITFRGQTKSVFVNAEIINGKAVIDANIIQYMLSAVGCQRGNTYTLG